MLYGDVIKTKSNCLNIGEILRDCVINYIDKSKPKNTALDYIKIIIKNVERFLINDERSRVSFAISMIGCDIGWPDIADVFKIYRAYFTKLQNLDKICDVIVFAYSKDDFKKILDKNWSEIYKFSTLKRLFYLSHSFIIPIRSGVISFLTASYFS